jgi:hypothetical protein
VGVCCCSIVIKGVCDIATDFFSESHKDEPLEAVSRA